MTENSEQGQLVEDALEIAFGDGERDPGPTIDALQRDVEARRALERHVATLRTLRASSDGVKRLEVLLAETGGADRGATVVPIGAARRSVPAGRGRRAWIAPAIGFALAAGAALFVWQSRSTPTGAAGAPEAPLADVRADLDQAAMTSLGEAVSSTGLGFAGAQALGPAGSGYLLAAALDAESSAARPGGEASRVIALGYAEQVAAELVPPIAAEKALRAGCSGLFADKPALAACEHGAFAYRMKRDLGSPVGDRRGRTPAARAFVEWAASRIEPAANASLLRARLDAPAAPVDAAERDAWRAVLTNVRAALAI